MVLGRVPSAHDNRRMSPNPSERVAETERWFIHRGIPHFIDGYSASQDIFTRAAPLLTFIFLIEVFAAVNFEAW